MRTSRVRLRCCLLAASGLLWLAGCGRPAREEFPAWAYPVVTARDQAVMAQAPADDGRVRHVPDSAVGLTRAQFAAHTGIIADWHPEEHPAMPVVVRSGREPAVWACAYCNLPNGAGRPENASLAGLPEVYLIRQIAEFRRGNRPSSAPGRGPHATMLAIAHAVNDAEIAEAARYFAALRPRSFLRVVETDEVPRTYVAGSMLARLPGQATEPLAGRVIEVPDDLEQTENRDSHTTYTVYAPRGSLARGEAIVQTGAGGRVPRCASCHGEGLKGLAEVPRLAGRSPSFLMRQLYDLKHGKRTGQQSALMQPVVAQLSQEDLVAVVAYFASLQP